MATLIAAGKAVSNLRDRRAIEITGISGTSAGSIVAALLAARCDFEEVRAEIAGPAGQKLLAQFPTPSRAAALVKILCGKTLWSEKPLGDWLGAHFMRSVGNRNPRISDLAERGAPLFIVCSNVGAGGVETFDGNKDAVEAVLDSAGLPFCFRTWKRGAKSVRVDGGLAENLPVDALLGRETEHGRAVAFTFRESKNNPPDSLFRFAMGMIDVAINRSVGIAQLRVGSDFVCPLETDLTTFDFAKAREFLNNKFHFDRVVQDVENWFKCLCDRVGDHSMPDVWNRPSVSDFRSQMSRIGKIYAHHHSETKFRYSSIKSSITANCLFEDGAAGERKPDEAHYEFRITPTDKPIFAHKLSMSSGSSEKFYGEYRATLTDEKSNRNVPFECIASINPDAASRTDRQLIAFFRSPLNSGSGPYRLTLQDRGMDLVKDLKTGDGFIFSLSRAAGKVDSLSVAIHVPTDYPRIVLEKCEVGLEAMSDVECTQTFGQPPSVRFRTVGWRSTEEFEIPPGNVINVWLRARA